MAQRGAHARRAARLEAADAALHRRREALAERLDRIDLDAVAALTGEAVDRVEVADLLERDRHDDERVLRDVDDALVRVGCGLVGGRAHVEQEQRRDVALLAPARWRRASRTTGCRARALDARVDDGVQVDDLAVLEAVDRPVALGPHALEVPAHLGDQVGVPCQRAVEEEARVAGELDLAELAPGGTVVVDDVIPLVVDEHRGIGGGRPRPAAQPVTRDRRRRNRSVAGLGEPLADELRHVESGLRRQVAASLAEGVRPEGFDQPPERLGVEREAVAAGVTELLVHEERERVARGRRAARRARSAARGRR